MCCWGKAYNRFRKHDEIPSQPQTSCLFTASMHLIDTPTSATSLHSCIRTKRVKKVIWRLLVGPTFRKWWLYEPKRYWQIAPPPRVFGLTMMALQFCIWWCICLRLRSCDNFSGYSQHLLVGPSAADNTGRWWCSSRIRCQNSVSTEEISKNKQNGSVSVPVSNARWSLDNATVAQYLW